MNSADDFGSSRCANGHGVLMARDIFFFFFRCLIDAESAYGVGDFDAENVVKEESGKVDG